MHKVIEIDFDDDDFIEYDPIEVRVPWRNGEDRGVEILSAHPQVPLGVLWRLETESDPRTMAVLIAAALRDDDHDLETLEKDDEDRGSKGDTVPVKGTSSIERWNTLIDDFDRRPPGKAIGKILRALIVEYSNRNNPELAASRPTGQSGPSSGGPSPTGRSGTAGRGKRALTSTGSKRQPA